jgi:hypothetical protein
MAIKKKSGEQGNKNRSRVSNCYIWWGGICGKFFHSVEAFLFAMPSTGGGTTEEARSEPTAKTKVRARPGRSHPVVSEFECAALTGWIWMELYTLFHHERNSSAA